MFPQYGSIFSKYSNSANTPDKVVTATVTALTEFWRMFLAEYSAAKFIFVGTSIAGPVVTPITGLISRIQHFFYCKHTFTHLRKKSITIWKRQYCRLAKTVQLYTYKVFMDY